VAHPTLVLGRPAPLRAPPWVLVVLGMGHGLTS
jgi:hypothetical protein